MPISGETEYTVRAPYPNTYKHLADNTVELPVYLSGALVEPTAYLFTLKSPDGTVVVDGATATPVSSVATYTIAAALLDKDLTGVSLGEGWQEVWTLTVGGVVHTWDRSAALALRPIAPTVADTDLLAEYPNLARWTGETTWQTYLDAAWHAIIRRWLREGGATYLVKEAYAFHDAHLHFTLSKVLASLGAERDNAEMTELSDKHMKMYKAHWPEIVSTMDWDHDGRPDDPTRRQRRGLVLHVNAPPSTSSPYLGRRRRY